MQRDAEREADCVSSNLTDLPDQPPRREHSARPSLCWSFSGAEMD